MTLIYTSNEESSEDNEKDSTFFDNKDAALQHACQRALELIERQWDMDDESQRDSAKEIERYIRNGSYQTALRDFNDIESNRDYPCSLYISGPTGINSSSPAINFIDWSQYECNGEDDEEECDEEEEDETPFVATSPGATCRGPCQSHSMDAYADQRDGTFLCYQCKLMKQVFSS